MDSMIPLPKAGRLWKSKADFFRPFRAAATDAGENIIALYVPSRPRSEPEEPDLKDLNACLNALVDIFPDVQPEVFREMLTSLGEESRLQVVTEHLLQQKAKWVRGRYRTPTPKQGIARDDGHGHQRALALPPRVLRDENLFRSDIYKKAVKQVLYQEFKSLSHSTIKGVMAEQNFSYAMSRPILLQLSAKSWRSSLSSLWSGRASSATGQTHPCVTWTTYGSFDGKPIPAMRCTGSDDLDTEIYQHIVLPLRETQIQGHIQADEAIAHQLNETEATEAHALFDCECCYDSVTFEQIAVCDDSSHLLCFNCIRRTVNESLYGQGWSGTTDLRKATVRCFSPTSDACSGCMPGELVRRALEQGTAEHTGLWEKFQARITSETLLQSGYRLQRCRSCDYAEVDDVPTARLKHLMAIWHHVVTQFHPAAQIMVLLLLVALPIFTIPFVILALATYINARFYPPARRMLADSMSRVHKRRRTLKFQCQNPACLDMSCTRCMSLWRDPHTCFESETTTLRTTIEASATAAIKRTCPRCMLSFVKDSGCNKLVCNCGYVMCYICRQEISAKEGYSHFCQHFRPSGGRCSECERCDLYGDEDEDAAIRKAAKDAEKTWRETESGKDGDQVATQMMIDALVDQARGVRWTADWLDALVDAVVA